MRKQTTLRPLVRLALAVLLLAPAAHAAKPAKGGKSAKSSSVRAMSEGLGHLQRGEHDAAVEALRKAARAKGTVSSYFLLGWAHYQRGFRQGSPEAADLADARAAVDAFALALGLDPTLSELPDPSRLHFARAVSYEALARYDKALESYKAAFRAGPRKSLAPLHAARLRLKMKDRGMAVANIELALRKAGRAGQVEALRAAALSDPAFASLVADPRARRALGVAEPKPEALVASLDAKEGELRDAVRDAAPSAPAAPVGDPKTLERVAEGDARLALRRHMAAIAAYRQALALDEKARTLGFTRVAALHERIGLAYNKLGQHEAASEALEKALSHNPMNPDARYQLAVSRALAGKPAASLETLKEAFAACAVPSDLRRLVMQSKTDAELAAVRDLPGYREELARRAGRAAL